AVDSVLVEAGSGAGCLPKRRTAPSGSGGPASQTGSRGPDWASASVAGWITRAKIRAAYRRDGIMARPTGAGRNCNRAATRIAREKEGCYFFLPRMESKDSRPVARAANATRTSWPHGIGFRDTVVMRTRTRYVAVSPRHFAAHPSTMQTRASLLLRIRDPKDVLAWAEFV